MTDKHQLNDFQVLQLFIPLWDGADSDFHKLLNKENKIFLAHYTSVTALEQIVKSEEMWFSNPLFMNDLEELRLGIENGITQLIAKRHILEDHTDEVTAKKIIDLFNQYHRDFATKHALNVYVFCLSEHDIRDKDGRLSMWRGYGNNGNGAALVFNTNFITKKDGSPLIIAKVQYVARIERQEWFDKKFEEWCKILTDSKIPDSQLHLAVWHFFNLIKLYALKFKHEGFREENEWRIIYMPDYDISGILKDKYSYKVGVNGVGPILKLPIRPLPLEPMEKWTFESIIHSIILGPSISSVLATESVKRMFEIMGKKEFSEKVSPSMIPLRTK